MISFIFDSQVKNILLSKLQGFITIYNVINKMNGSLRFFQEWSLATFMSHEMTKESKRMHMALSGDLREFSENHIRENRP